MAIKLFEIEIEKKLKAIVSGKYIKLMSTAALYMLGLMDVKLIWLWYLRS